MFFRPERGQTVCLTVLGLSLWEFASWTAKGRSDPLPADRSYDQTLPIEPHPEWGYPRLSRRYLSNTPPECRHFGRREHRAFHLERRVIYSSAEDPLAQMAGMRL